MYPHLEAEMVMARVTGRELAQAVGMSDSTFSAKRTGKMYKGKRNCFTTADAFAIKKVLRSKLTLEKLFEWED